MDVSWDGKCEDLDLIAKPNADAVVKVENQALNTKAYLPLRTSIRIKKLPAKFL